MASRTETSELDELGVSDLIRRMQAASPSEASPFCEELIRRFEPLTRRAWRRLFQVVDYEDFVQQIFVQVFAGLPHLENVEAFPGYFQRVVLSVGADFCRKKAATGVTDVNLDELPSRLGIDVLTGIVVRSYLEQLTPRDAEVLLLEFVEGLTTAEIASQIRVQPGTVRNIKSRALRKLRRILLQSK